MGKKTRTVSPGQEVLPGYHAVALLSRGHRVDTYDVRSVERDCRCVVKVVREDRRHEQRIRDAVLLEATLLQRFTHPHLVRGYEVVEHPVPGMVLETLAGDTLDALIEDGPLGAADVAQLGLQLVSVLGYLHRQGWLHLDVKPANIVVENGRATLLDLSIAAPPGDGRAGAGTPEYRAPEQATGLGLSAATDVWGLGVTLFESLTGQLPSGDQAHRHGRGRLRGRHRPTPPPALEAAVPAGYANLLRGCLDLDPRARPSLHQVRSCLTTLLGEDTGAVGAAPVNVS